MGSLRSSEIQLPSWKGREGHDAQLVCTRAPGAARQPVSWSTAEADAVAPVSRARLSVLLPQSKHVSSEAVGPWWVTAVLVKGVVDRVAKTLLLAPARVWSHREGELLLPSVVLGDPPLQGPAVFPVLSAAHTAAGLAGLILTGWGGTPVATATLQRGLQCRGGSSLLILLPGARARILLQAAGASFSNQVLTCPSALCSSTSQSH